MRIRISEETINKIHLSKICFVYFFLHHKHKFELLKYRYLIPGVTIRTRNLIYIRMCWMYTNVNSIRFKTLLMIYVMHGLWYILYIGVCKRRAKLYIRAKVKLIISEETSHLYSLSASVKCNLSNFLANATAEYFWT